MSHLLCLPTHSWGGVTLRLYSQTYIAERAEKKVHGTLMMYIQHRLVKGTQIATSLVPFLSKERARLLKRLGTRLRLLHDLLT